MSLADELYKAPNKNAWNQPEQPGLVIAEVMDIKDPQNLGRIKCRALTDEDANQNDWCYVMAPYASKECGIQFMPAVGDMVVLGFIGGDRQRPLVLGGLWNNKIPMPYPIKDGKNFSYAIKTPIGTEVLMEGEKKDEAKLTVKTPAETTFVMDDKEKSVTVQDKNGDNLIKMDLKGGEISITAKAKITLKAKDTELVLDGKGNKLTGTAKQEASLSAQNVKLDAKTKLSGAGTQVAIEAKSKLDLKGKLTALEGVTTNVKGSAMLNLN